MLNRGPVVTGVLAFVTLYNTCVLLTMFMGNTGLDPVEEVQIEVDALTAHVRSSMSSLDVIVPELKKQMSALQTARKQERAEKTKVQKVSADDDLSQLFPPTAHNKLTKSRYGVMLYNTEDIYIGKAIKLYGEWYETMLDYARLVIRKGDTVLDIGANIGVFTIPLAQIVGQSGKVYAFEPQRVVFQTLCANVQLNQLRNVLAYPDAISDKPGAFTWDVHPKSYTTPANFGDFKIKDTLDAKSFRIPEGLEATREPVIMDTADSFEPIGPVKYVKISVNNDFVIKTLEGIKGIVDKHRPVLYITVPNDEDLQIGKTYLRNNKYQIVEHTQHMYRAANFKKNTNSEMNYVSLAWFCIPLEMWDSAEALKDKIIKGTDTKVIGT